MNNGKPSAQERRIIALEARLRELETMRKEYSALLNYLVSENGGEFLVREEGLKEVMADERVIRTEIIDHAVYGRCMKFTRCDGPEKPLIIKG